MRGEAHMLLSGVLTYGAACAAMRDAQTAWALRLCVGLGRVRKLPRSRLGPKRPARSRPRVCGQTLASVLPDLA
jgi:hypothetical protein